MRQSEGMSPALTEAIRKLAEPWIDAQERTPDEVKAMLAGMKCRVAELTGEHRYRGLGFVPHECHHYDRESFLAGRRLAESLPIDPKARRPARTASASAPRASPPEPTRRGFWYRWQHAGPVEILFWGFNFIALCGLMGHDQWSFLALLLIGWSVRLAWPRRNMRR
jgi:hypothetical protein